MENGSAVVKIPATGSERVKVTASFVGGDRLAYAEVIEAVTAPDLSMEHRPGALSAPTAPPTLVRNIP